MTKQAAGAAARHHVGEAKAPATPDPLRGALSGLVAGLVASLAMDLAQKALTKLQSSDNDDGGEPATEQAADKISRSITGKAVPETTKPLAGQAVHYAFGGLLGMGYGIAAEYSPEITVGGGSAFAVATAALFDEAAVPAAGLGPAPWDADLATHLYALGSHLVFGTVTEATRRSLRAAL